MTRKTSKDRFLANEDISHINKEHVRNFFKSYNCANTTKEKFYSFLPYILTKTDDLKQDMNNNGKLAGVFDKLHDRLSPSSYKIALDCAKRFCKYLNAGEVPQSFADVKQLTTNERKKLARVKKSDYHTLSWEDALKMSELTNSIQIKALILTQMDGGFRPTELENLNYDDCKKDGKFIVCKVRETKTGEPRDVLIYKAAPFLSRWMQLHPTKKKKHPLWLQESRNKNKPLRYTYDAIRQLMRRLGERAGLGTISLYMMRHSAVALTKQERMGVDIAAEKFGHDINYYINVYGRLTDKQKIDRYKAHYGETKLDEKEKPKPLLCPICDTINEPNKDFCEKCNSPLNLTVALNQEKKKEHEISELKKQMAQLIAKVSSIDEIKAELDRRRS